MNLMWYTAGSLKPNWNFHRKYVHNEGIIGDKQGF